MSQVQVLPRASFFMKTLIIPDIHHRISRLKQILVKEAPDRVIFLGDWFDDFGDNEDISANTAKWLAHRMDTYKEDVFIWGNHDTSYGFPGDHTSCSGFTEGKCRVIRDIMCHEHWNRFVFYHWENNWLFSHAGLTKYHVTGIQDVKSWLNDQQEEAQVRLRRKMLRHWMFTAGRARYGSAPFGGLTWCDLDEFAPLNDINQVFGHTPQRRVWKYDGNKRNSDLAVNSENYCLDTDLAFYGSFDGKKLDIHS